MANFDVEAMIELIKKHAFLYDLGHKKYKDTQLKNAIWESIAQKLNRNCDTVKHKWKTVRDGYIKYKKMVKDTEGSGKRVIEYIWSNQLSFLDSCAVRRKPNPKVLQSYNNFELNEASLPEQQNEDSPETTSLSPTPSQWPSEDGEPPAKRKKLELDQSDLDQILQYVNNTRLNSNNAVDHLFMSYAKTFKKFSPRRQAEMKIELAKLFSNAELNELKYDNDPIGMAVAESSDMYFNVKTEEYNTNNIES